MPGAVIGAERQWRQRMAGLRTNALVATGAAVFILSSMSTDPASAGRAAQVVSGIGFLGAGVIMREGLNIRGSTPPPRCGVRRGSASFAARPALGCGGRHAGYPVRQYPAARSRAAHQPAAAPAGDRSELCYRIQVTCGEQDEILVRTLILQALNGVALRLQSLRSADISSPGQLEVCAEITATPAAQKKLRVLSAASARKSVSAVRWRVASELPV